MTNYSPTAVITATADDNDNIKAECKIIVRPKKAAVKNISYYKYIGSKKRHVYFTTKVNGNYSGFQTKYSKRKSMKKAKTVKESLYLKKGTYYFRTRAYIEIDGKKYYGE